MLVGWVYVSHDSHFVKKQAHLQAGLLCKCQNTASNISNVPPGQKGLETFAIGPQQNLTAYSRYIFFSSDIYIHFLEEKPNSK